MRPLLQFIKKIFIKKNLLQKGEYHISLLQSPLSQRDTPKPFTPHHISLQDQIIHRNGYIREAALDNLLEEPQKNIRDLISLLIPRMNDHVPVIRQKATLQFSNIFQDISVEELLIHHKLIDRLAQTKHLKETDFLENIHLKIKQNPQPFLLTTLKKSTPPEQIFILKALAREIEKDETFFISILMSISPSTKRYFAVMVSPWTLSPMLITKLLHDSSSFLNQAALRKFSKADIHLHKKDLTQLIYDRAKRVRYLARFVLRSVHDFDIHQTYVSLLENSPAPRTGAILGFLEVATLKDAPLIKSYLNHPTKTIRAAALVSLHTQSAPGTTEIVLKSLMDKSSFVRNAAVNLAQKSPTSLENEVRSLMFAGPDYAKGACFGLLIRRRNFQSLLDILTVLVTDQQTLEERALIELTQWTIGHHASPNKGLYDNILAQIDLFEALQNPSYQAWLYDNAYRWERLKAEIKWIGYK